MKNVSTIFAAGLIFFGLSSSRAVDLTLDSVTANANGTAQINVIWSSTTPISLLSTEFIITAVSGAPSGGVTFTNTAGTPAMPPINNPSYVFYNNSFDYINSPSTNPASVTMTSWASDTYNLADGSDDNTSVTQPGTNLWTILNLTIASGASGQYQLTIGSSAYDSGASSGLVPTMTGGLITINAVPEPSTYALAAIASIVIAGMARSRRLQTVQA